MSTKAIPKRSEVPVEDTWDLSDIFASDEAWEAEFEAMKALPKRIAALQGTLGRSAGDLLGWFRLQDELSVRLTKLHGYANCSSDQDTADARYVDMKSRAMSVVVAISSSAAFAVPEIMAIPEETLEGFYKAEPALEEYRRSLYLIRREAAHILSPECSPHRLRPQQGDPRVGADERRALRKGGGLFQRRLVRSGLHGPDPGLQELGRPSAPGALAPL